MPRARIVDSHSHMFGEAVLDGLFPDMKAEVIKILAEVPVPAKSKVSKEKTKKGQLIWTGPDFNKPLGEAFKNLGWKKRRLYYPGQSQYYIEVDFCKGRVGVEAQFGKYSFVQHDFAKFQYLLEEADESKRIDVGIEIVPCAALQREMYTGPANFESVVMSMKARARNDPPVPIWLLAIDVE